jgi:hypothetical protein
VILNWGCAVRSQGRHCGFQGLDGPADTVRVIWLPGAKRVPATGLWATTVPAGRLAGACLMTMCEARIADLSVATACWTLRPTVDGTTAGTARRCAAGGAVCCRWSLAPQRPDQSLLHQVLGFLCVAGQHVAEPEQRRKRPGDKRAETLAAKIGIRQCPSFRFTHLDSPTARTVARHYRGLSEPARGKRQAGRATR